MRRLLTFACEGATLAGTIDGDGTAGILLVTGGSQTRIGSHRMYEKLAKSLTNNGYATLRFDRRGVGDSDGEDPGFRGSAADLAAAAAAFRTECPRVERMFGFGLCDGATALALFGTTVGLSGVILVNPWLLEAASGEPPAAAIRHHYRQRLSSVAGWRKLLTGSVSFGKLAGGLKKIASRQSDALAAQAADALKAGPPAVMILARGDATAIAAEAEWKSARFAAMRSEPIYIESDSHTFARPGDAESLLSACIEALRRLES